LAIGVLFRAIDLAEEALELATEAWSTGLALREGV
jgi:hypothetical protein